MSRLNLVGSFCMATVRYRLPYSYIQLQLISRFILSFTSASFPLVLTNAAVPCWYHFRILLEVCFPNCSLWSCDTSHRIPFLIEYIKTELLFFTFKVSYDLVTWLIPSPLVSRSLLLASDQFRIPVSLVHLYIFKCKPLCFSPHIQE